MPPPTVQPPLLAERQSIGHEDDIEGYTEFLNHIGREIDSARIAVAKTANQVITRSYWEIGRRIVELEQCGKSRTELYGERIIDRLSVDLARRYGRGFSRSNLYNFKAFYIMKNIIQTPSGQSFPLSWSHYTRLLSVKDPSARVFYEESAIRVTVGLHVSSTDKSVRIFTRGQR
jgi:hypothetical protein